jgi:aldehyde dehydrogenase (NAD+)
MAYNSTFTKHNHYFDTNITRDFSWRKQQLQAIKSLVVENEKSLLNALQEDLAKPTLEAWITEISYITNDVDHVCKHLNSWAKPKRVNTPLLAQPGKSFIKPEPQGTVLIIGAWNYPLQLVLAPLIAVISAGNCAVIKPSELAPAVSTLLAELIPKYLDNQAISVIEGGISETTELLTLPFDHIMYTGNGQVARIIMAAAAKNLTPVTLELGGKSPVYIDESADLTITAQRIAWGKWMNAGQTCIAPDYILVKESLLEPLALALKSQITAMFGKNPKDSKSYGRIINQRHCQRITSYFTDGEVIAGGESDIENCYVAPTIIINPSLDSPLMREEIFGAILPIVKIENFDEAKSFVKQREKPLSAYIFSRNTEQVNQWVNEISAGSQCINDVIMFSAVPDLPFGGTGPSGMGQYSGKAGFDNFSHLKSVLKRPFMKDLPLRFAPYSKFKLRILRFIR